MSSKVVDGLPVLITGNAHRPLAEGIASALQRPLAQCLVGRYPDGEVRVTIEENMRGEDTFIIQPTHATGESCADNLFELLAIVDALRRASARERTAVIPYFGHGRQDRKDKPRVPITAKLCMNLLVAAGVTRVVTTDLHAGQIQGFADVPIDNLYGREVLIPALRSLALSPLVVAGADLGAMKYAGYWAEALGAEVIGIDKRRVGPDDVEVKNIIGEVHGRHVAIVDDEISGGRTAERCALALKERGALSVTIAATHAKLRPVTIQRLMCQAIDRVVITNTLPLPDSLPSKFDVYSIAPLIAKAITCIHNDTSLSGLFVQ